MLFTNDQYVGLAKLQKWWRKYTHQIIEVSGTIGTGVNELIQSFIELIQLDPREVIYLSYNQREVLDLAFNKLHSYYINNILYSYSRIVDFDSIPVINPSSKELVYQWKKKLKTKLDSKYKLMIVSDSTLLSLTTIKDLASFGLPIILLRDPLLLPSYDTHTFLLEANINLQEQSSKYNRDPLVYIANRVINHLPIAEGNYDALTIINRKRLNLYNLKSSDMILTLSDALSDTINASYREKILNRKNTINILGERLILDETLYGRKIINQDNTKVKVYLTKGSVGNITRINKHASNTKYVSMDFKLDIYHEPFSDIALDRHHLNGIEAKSYQLKPDEVAKFSYAYALSTPKARFSNWDKVVLILDKANDSLLETSLIYTAITRAKDKLIIAL